MEPLVLRDCLSVTGVDSPGRAMAVGGQGQLIFKKSSNQFTYYDIQEISTTILELSKKDPLYADCQIYDISFCRSGNLLVCLQRPSTGDLFICEGVIDPQERIVDISGAVYRTKLVAVRGRNVSLVHDEAGVVILSYPIRWQPSGNCIELFHASNFLQAGNGDKFTMSLSTKDSCDATFSSVFISRNHLYMFYATDYSRFLLVPLVGSSCGKCEVRSTHGVPPSDAYMGKVVQVFEDFVLVYAFMNIRSGLRPNLYMLNLTNLKWYPMNLTLSHHFPNGKVSFQKVGEDMVYLHGDCNISGCSEKSHLYQINIESIGALILPRIRSQSVAAPIADRLHSQSAGALSQLVKRSSSLSQCSTPPSTPTLGSGFPLIYPKSDPPVQRYKKKQGKDEMVKRRYSQNLNKNSGSSMNSYDDDLCALKRAPSCSSVHWCADMAEQSGSSLQEQIKLAHEMGFTEGDVINALKMKPLNEDGFYEPFTSTNAMLDLLHQASGKTDPKLKLSVYDENSTKSPGRLTSQTPRSASLSRSSTFHVGSRSARQDSHDLFRVIQTLEREKDRDKREVEQQFAILKTRIHDLERDLEREHHEKEKLREENETHVAELDRKSISLRRFEQESSEMREKIDRLTIDCLHLEKDLDNQKELAEHRKKNYEEDTCKKEEAFVKLQAETETVKKELERKSALLDEQTNIARRMEERHTSLQSGILLEKIAAESLAIRKHQEASVLAQTKVQQFYDELLARFPALEEENRSLRLENEKSCRQAEEDKGVLRREIRGLQEKSTAECCICLTTKPNVVFMPCRHLAVCGGCVEDSSMKECPTCRTAITDSLIIFC